jgi:hypothetical protein
MLNGKHNLGAWKKIGAFQVFGDYMPMQGFRMVVQVGLPRDVLEGMLESRAPTSDALDPTLARWNIRAGLGLVRSGLASFVYATPEETIVVVRAEALRGAGSPLRVENQFLSMYAARLSMLAQREVPVHARIYEFPDIIVVRRALGSLIAEIEDTTPLRSSIWLGHQLRGRGQPFHPSMLETLEEQTTFLSGHGIDMDQLPSWWWRGVAAQVTADGAINVFDELPSSEEFGALVPE